MIDTAYPHAMNYRIKSGSRSDSEMEYFIRKEVERVLPRGLPFKTWVMSEHGFLGMGWYYDPEWKDVLDKGKWTGEIV